MFATTWRDSNYQSKEQNVCYMCSNTTLIHTKAGKSEHLV